MPTGSKRVGAITQGAPEAIDRLRRCGQAAGWRQKVTVLRPPDLEP